MPLANKLASFWRNLRHRAQLERDLGDELAAHLEMLVEAGIAQGLTPEQARRRARIELGGMEQVKEEVRDARVGHWLATWVQDLRYAGRTLRRRPGFTLTVVLTLALGIGANAAIFALVNAVLLRPLPVGDPGGLVMLTDGDPGSYGGPLKPARLQLISYPLFQRLRAETGSFRELAAQQSGETASVVRRADGAGTGGAELAFGRAVSSNYFDVLGVTPHRGRGFTSGDQTANGANPVVVLSHRFWQRGLGGDPAIVGARLSINGTVYTVVGIGPPHFTGTRLESRTDLWVPLTMHAALTRGPDRLPQPNSGWLLVMGRLRPGLDAGAAQADVNVILQRFLADHPALTRPVDRPRVLIALQPGAHGVSQLRPALREPLLLLSAGAGLLLLIVCFNLSHLLLARAVGRQREMSIRAALGAGRARLVRQLAVESLLLCLLGGAAALIIGRLMAAGLMTMVSTEGTSLVLHVEHDVRTLAFTASLAVGSALMLGLVSGWFGGRADLRRGLGSAAPTVAGGGVGQRLVSRALLASQVAVSLVLLVGAGLLAGSLQRLRRVDKGFDSEHVVQVELNTRMIGLNDRAVQPLYGELLTRVRQLPGVSAASLAHPGLLSGSTALTRVNRPGTTSLHDSTDVSFSVVTPDHFRALGMVMLQGRGFTSADHGDAPEVVVINQAFARRHFGSADPIGQRLHIPKPRPEQLEVVGVVRDVRTAGLRLDPPPMIYQPAAQERAFLDSLQVRTTGDPGRLMSELRRALHEAQPTLPILGMRTMDDQVQRSLAGDRIVAALAAAFGLLALLLVCLGLYGVMSHWAAQRTAEIGVRMALGATPADTRWLVLRQALALVLLGLALGVPAAIGGGRLIATFLFELPPTHLPTLAGAALVLLAVSLLAAYAPARRASRIEPLSALRWE